MAKPQNLQAAFLDHVSDNRVMVSIFLLNGVKMQGIIVGHDNYTVQVIHRGQAQSIFKRAISTVVPDHPINLWDGKVDA